MREKGSEKERERECVRERERKTTQSNCAFSQIFAWDLIL